MALIPMEFEEDASYSTTGLSYTNCTRQNGGYAKIGNLCVVNMELKASSESNLVIEGFPAPKLGAGVSGDADVGTEHTPTLINSQGKCTVYKKTLTLGTNSIFICFVYLV